MTFVPAKYSRRFAVSMLGAAPFLLNSTLRSIAQADIEKLDLAMLANLDAGPMLLAEEKGFFRQAGLNAQVHTGGTGATIIPTVLSGQYPIGYANVISDLMAIDKGLPLLLIHPAYGNPTEVAKDTYFIYAKPDSKIKVPADLLTARIGSISLRNINEWTTRKSLENLGFKETDKIKWTRVSNDDGIKAVLDGELDAIWMSQPFGAKAAASGLVPILAANANSLPGAVGGYYITSRKFATAYPGVIAKFKAAMTHANSYATEHPDEARNVVIKRLDFDPALVKASELNLYPNDMNETSLKIIASDLVRYGMISKAPNASDIFWKAA